jgi:AcrR family transcriptional regulator
MPTTAARSDGVPRRRDPRATYEAILDAALTTMAEHGPDALSVSEVAHRAAVNRTTAYQHFRTREQLIAAVIGRVSQEVQRVLESEMPLGERIDRLLELHIRRPEIPRLWLFHMLAGAELLDERALQRFRENLRVPAASDRARPEIDPEMLACVLLGATLVWSLRTGHGPAAEARPHEESVRFGQELKRLLALGVGG